VCVCVRERENFEISTSQSFNGKRPASFKVPLDVQRRTGEHLVRRRACLAKNRTEQSSGLLVLKLVKSDDVI
jgi:hypothetical protein